MSNKKKIAYKSLNIPIDLFPNSKKHSYDMYKNSKKFPGLPASSTYNNLKLITKENFSKLENKQFKKLNPNFPKYTQIFTEITKKNQMPAKNRNESDIMGNTNVKMKLSRMINQDFVSNNTASHLLDNTNPNSSNNKEDYFTHFNSLKKQSLKFNTQQNYTEQKIDLFANFKKFDNEKSTRPNLQAYNIKSSNDRNTENKSYTKNKSKEDLSKIKIRINCENKVPQNNYINGGYVSIYPLTPKDTGKIRVLATEGNIETKLEANRRSNFGLNNPPPIELINNRNVFLLPNKNAMPSNKENSTLGFTISTIYETKMKKGKISIDSNGDNNLHNVNQNSDKKIDVVINNIPEEIHLFYVNMIQSGKNVEKKGIQGE